MHRQKKTKFTRPRSCKLHLTCTVKRFFQQKFVLYSFTIYFFITFANIVSPNWTLQCWHCFN